MITAITSISAICGVLKRRTSHEDSTPSGRSNIIGDRWGRGSLLSRWRPGPRVRRAGIQDSHVVRQKFPRRAGSPCLAAALAAVASGVPWAMAREPRGPAVGQSLASEHQRRKGRRTSQDVRRSADPPLFHVLLFAVRPLRAAAERTLDRTSLARNRRPHLRRSRRGAGRQDDRGNPRDRQRHHRGCRGGRPF